jgi:hypothetical protein
MTHLQIALYLLAANAVARPSWQAVGALALMVALTALQTFVERKKKDDLERFDAELSLLKNKVEGLLIHKGMGR